MKWNDIVRKLTSRKFRAALAGFVTALLVAFNIDNLTIEQVVVVLGGAATLIAYIVGEGIVDAKQVEGETMLVEVDNAADNGEK